MGIVKELRESRRLSQTDLARKCGVSQAAISKLESGEVAAKNVSLAEVGKHLGVDGTDFSAGVALERCEKSRESGKLSATAAFKLAATIADLKTASKGMEAAKDKELEKLMAAASGHSTEEGEGRPSRDGFGTKRAKKTHGAQGSTVPKAAEKSRDFWGRRVVKGDHVG